MSEDLIRYDILTQDALRGVVRKVLAEVAKTGLPGDHHFYVSFQTTAPGVRISSRLLKDYPEEMTIVVQHQFWDLKVNEHSFEIGLSFGNTPEKLLVPFNALRGFVDPSVQFGLQFETVATSPPSAVETEETEAQDAPVALAPAAAGNEQTEAAETAEPASTSGETGDGEEEAPQQAEVVSLDAFRKK